MNQIQFFEREALRHFYERWKSTDRVVIAHFGDSHVQPGIFPGKMRSRLQQERGDAGFGMVFPYAAAKTYSAIDYITNHTGLWLFSKSLEPRPKLPLGIAGATVRTEDPTASFTIRFKKNLDHSPLRLRIFCKLDSGSFDLMVKSGTQEVPVRVAGQKSLPIEITLDQPDSSIRVNVVRRDKQSSFEFYGMSLERPASVGLIHHALGIGGSKYGSLLVQSQLDAQLPLLQPDLVILDFGTNDILYTNTIPADLEAQIHAVIQKVRKSVPGASILLTTTQDMYRRGEDITAAITFASMVRRIAKTDQCAFYDWYWVSGGPKTMTRWRDAGLARTDLIHLTIQGYEFKGDLLAQSVLDAIRTYPLVTDSLSLWSETRRLLQPDTLGTRKDSITIAKQPVLSVQHLIVKGETLESIAQKYHVQVADIMKDNRLDGTVIREGKYLTIHPASTASRPVADVRPAKTSRHTKYVMHKIKSGETLSEIAEEYHVSVTQLQRLNGLKSTRIRAGKSLKIKPL